MLCSGYRATGRTALAETARGKGLCVLRAQSKGESCFAKRSYAPPP
jgi:hypothetical protein